MNHRLDQHSTCEFRPQRNHVDTRIKIASTVTKRSSCETSSQDDRCRFFTSLPIAYFRALAEAWNLAEALCADRLNGGEAHDHDQGEHDRVFDSRRAIFRDEKLLDTVRELDHDTLRIWARTPRAFLANSGRDIVTPDAPRIPVQHLGTPLGW